MENKKFIAKNITTGEEIQFDSYSDAHDIAKVGPHAIKDNYLDKPIQCHGWTFRSHENPYWEPPVNFIFNPGQKASTKMIMCKSINLKTKETTFFNSILEAVDYISNLYPEEFPNNDTNRRTLNRVISDKKPTTKVPLIYYAWSKIEKCGHWVYPDGHKEEINGT